MAINSIAGNGANHSVVADAARAATNRAQSQTSRQDASQGSGSDTVTLTGTASQLRALQAQLVSQPVVDTGRVQSVRNDLNAGTFVIDPPKVAQKMLDMESMINAKLYA